MKNQKFQLVKSDYPSLRAVSEPVKDFEVATLRGHLYWLQKLRKGLNKPKAAAISAPQLGDNRRWWVWHRGLVINPKLLDHGFGTEKAIERCLSFPGFEAPRERWSSIEVMYVDENNVTHLTQLTGQTARIFQHELDHLNGVCIDTPQTKLE